jgi:hypothetical protein
MLSPSTISEKPPFASEDSRWQLVQRIVHSSGFRSTARLRDFLLYVTECAIRNAPEDATEQQVGINVFGRAPGYNCSEDSIVRTNARLLRQKLSEYFAQEGSAEELIVDIPKGHYLPIFRPAHGPVTEAGAEPAGAVASTGTPAPRTSASPRLDGRMVALAALVLAIVTVAAFFLGRRSLTRGAAPAPPVPKENRALEALWAPFFTGGTPLIIYSNAVFVGNSKQGLRYAAPGEQTTPEDRVDTYTGIGEAAAVYDLTQLFDAHHAQFILKRSLLVTWDEARMKNLVFIGSRAENPSLRVLPDTSDFALATVKDQSVIVNRNPGPGEPGAFSRPEHPLTRDYAIVALLPGVEPGKWILTCSGLTTFGTQAAVEFVSQPQSVQQLFQAAKFPHHTVRPFEAVLETTIAGGVPLQTHLVAIHTH